MDLFTVPDPPAKAGDVGSIPGSGRSPGGILRERQHLPVHLPGEFHGQRPWWATFHEVTKESDRLATKQQQQSLLNSYHLKTFIHILFSAWIFSPQF